MFWIVNYFMILPAFRNRYIEIFTIILLMFSTTVYVSVEFDLYEN